MWLTRAKKNSPIWFIKICNGVECKVSSLLNLMQPVTKPTGPVHNTACHCRANRPIHYTVLSLQDSFITGKQYHQFHETCFVFKEFFFSSLAVSFVTFFSSRRPFNACTRHSAPEDHKSSFDNFVAVDVL